MYALRVPQSAAVVVEVHARFLIVMQMQMHDNVGVEF